MTNRFELVFRGSTADRQVIEYYDVAQALWGFERVLSLTSHLLLNGQVITQSPSAKGFTLAALPPENGSWKWPVVLALGGIAATFGTASFDSAFGYLAKSALEYVIQETLGFTPDFEETLGSQIQFYRDAFNDPPIAKDLSQSRFDSLIEKTESGIRAIHRPIVASGTATVASVDWAIADRRGSLDGYFDERTFQYIDRTIRKDDFEVFCGVISSYNANTYNGRLYSPTENRTVPFDLAESGRTLPAIRRIVTSLRDNATRSTSGIQPDICLKGLRNESVNGRLKKLYVVEVQIPTGARIV